MTADESRQMLAVIFDTVPADGEGVARLELTVLPAGDRAEDGSLCAQCETTRLVRDERGWLRLAG